MAGWALARHQLAIVADEKCAYDFISQRPSWRRQLLLLSIRLFGDASKSALVGDCSRNVQHRIILHFSSFAAGWLTVQARRAGLSCRMSETCDIKPSVLVGGAGDDAICGGVILVVRVLGTAYVAPITIAEVSSGDINKWYVWRMWALKLSSLSFCRLGGAGLSTNLGDCQRAARRRSQR